MSEFNIDWSKIGADTQNGEMIPMGSDHGLIATFYMGKVPNFDFTDYVEVPHIRLRAPGSDTVYDQPVRMDSCFGRLSDPERFPVQYQAFLNGQNFQGGGTPLRDWAEVSEGDVRRLEINGVATVEQLATVADVHLDGLGFGAKIIRNKARAFLNGQSSVDPEKAELKDQVSNLQSLVEELMARMTDPDAPATQGRTRAKKEVANG